MKLHSYSTKGECIDRDDARTAYEFVKSRLIHWKIGESHKEEYDEAVKTLLTIAVKEYERGEFGVNSDKPRKE